MRPLNKSETRLAWIAGVTGLILVTVYGLGWLLQRQGQLDLDNQKLHATQLEGQLLLADQTTWEKRAAWLQQTAPVLGEEGKTKAEVLETALQGARNNHLQILEQALGEIQKGPIGMAVSAKLRVTGSMEDLCRWVSALQNPESFYAVTAFSLRASDTDKTIICSLTIKRFYKP